MPDYVSLSNVFIDDILLWDGRIFLGVLGGAGVHAMAGARVWSDSIGLIASVGEDFEEAFERKLRSLGMDLSMLKVAQDKTTRAWQIFQPDEERIEILRDKRTRVHQISLEDIELPEPYRNALGYHIHISGSVDYIIANLEILRTENPAVKLVMEPTLSNAKWGRNAFSKVFSYLDLFSPNLIEGEAITGHKSPEKMIQTLLDWGASKVSLRMGEQGSMIAAQDKKIIKIPVVKGTVVDVTGAGNAYLGGMLVALCEGRHLTEAALRGTVSASFAIEQYGICVFNEGMIEARDRRLEKIRDILERESS